MNSGPWWNERSTSVGRRRSPNASNASTAPQRKQSASTKTRSLSLPKSRANTSPRARSVPSNLRGSGAAAPPRKRSAPTKTRSLSLPKSRANTLPRARSVPSNFRVSSPAHRSPSVRANAAPRRRTKRKGRTARRRGALARLDLAELQQEMPPTKFQKFMRALTGYLAVSSAVPLPKVNLAKGSSARWFANRAAAENRLQVYAGNPHVRTQHVASKVWLPGNPASWKPNSKSYNMAFSKLKKLSPGIALTVQLGVAKHLPLNLFEPVAIANREKAAGRKYGPQNEQFIGYKPPFKPAELVALHQKGNVRVPKPMLNLAKSGLPLLTNFPTVPANNSSMRSAFERAWPGFVNGTKWEGSPPPKSTDFIARVMKNPTGYRNARMPSLPKGNS